MVGAGDRSFTGGAALLRIAGCALPSALALALLLALAAAWQHWQPVAQPNVRAGLDRAIIEVQRQRAAALPDDVDVLIVGDSSGLMGIDPLALQARLGARVESLATLGYVGPAGYAALIRRSLDGGVRPARLLVVLHAASLERRPLWRAYENLAVSGQRRRPPPDGLVAGARARLLAVVEPVLYLPMDGPLGDYYGEVDGFTGFMHGHGGSAIDPTPPLQDRTPDLYSLVPVTLNDLMRSRLPPLAEVIRELGPERVRLVLTPQVDWTISPGIAAGREAARAELQRALGLDPARQLSLPDALPGPLFATYNHLDPAGRERFTALLAEALARDRAQWPWPRRDDAPRPSGARPTPPSWQR